MTEESVELKPCPNPWCPSHESENDEPPFVAHSRASFERRGSCSYCPVNGPWSDTEEEAIAAWNRRAPADAAALRSALEEAIEAAETLYGMLSESQRRQVGSMKESFMTWRDALTQDAEAQS